MLQLCAAFGKHSSFERMEKATGYQNHTLLDAIEELSSAVMLATDASGIAVKHDLLATAALDRLGGAAQRLVHRQVAGVLETEINERHTAAVMWDCAEHWQRAGETAHALATVRLCAKHLHSVGQVNDSIELCEKALVICVTAEERLETLLALVTSLKAAGKWLRLAQIVTEGEVVAKEQHRDDFIEDSLRLLRLETEWRLRAASDGSVIYLVNFAHDEGKHADHRLQAAHLGMILCSEKGRKEDAHALLSVVERLEPVTKQEALVAHTRMIFHADFGDLDNALLYGEVLLALETESGDPASISRARMNVAHCFRRAGRVDDARVLLNANLTFATDHSLDGQAARAAATLAMIALQEEDMNSAAYWHARAMNHARALDEKSLSDSLAYIKARLGLHQGDLGPAHEFLALFSGETRDEMSLRFRQTEATIRWRVQLASNREIDSEQLEMTAKEFERHCGSGLYDFFALSLYDALKATGQPGRAAEIICQYVKDGRRDRSPIPPSLAAVLDQLKLPA